MKPCIRYLFVCLLVFVAAGVSADEWVLEPAPVDRPIFDYKNMQVKHKRNKWGMIDPSPDMASLKYLPRDKYGFVDWSKGIKDGVISPRETIMGDPAQKGRAFDRDIIIRSKMAFMPDVLFPHSAHNEWLNCSPCHPKIFQMKAGATPLSMIGIWKGRFCGRCHDRVAFPIRNCFKCHSVKRRPPE